MQRESASVRRHGRLLVVLLLALALVAMFGVLAQQASASQDFVLCASCHSQADTHAKHGAVGCASCHTNGGTVPPPPSACATCHGAAAIVAKHPAATCGVSGCHGAPAPITTAVSLKVAPTSIKLKKTVTASGSVTPATELVGIKVALKAEIKVGKAWKAAKAGSVTVNNLGKYKWVYKPAKKGTYRMTATIKATDDYKGSKSPTRGFKVN